MDTKFTELRRAIKRLAKSDTRLKRRNARYAVRTELRTIVKAMDEEFPPLGTDGRPRRRVKMMVCPFCKLPQKALTTHIKRKHPGMVGTVTLSSRYGYTSNVCACGEQFASDKTMDRHLRRVDDLGAHFAQAVIRNAAAGAQP